MITNVRVELPRLVPKSRLPVVYATPTSLSMAESFTFSRERWINESSCRKHNIHSRQPLYKCSYIYVYINLCLNHNRNCTNPVHLILPRVVRYMGSHNHFRITGTWRCFFRGQKTPKIIVFKYSTSKQMYFYVL